MPKLTGLNRLDELAGARRQLQRDVMARQTAKSESEMRAEEQRRKEKEEQERSRKAWATGIGVVGGALTGGLGGLAGLGVAGGVAGAVEGASLGAQAGNLVAEPSIEGAVNLAKSVQGISDRRLKAEQAVTAKKKTALEIKKLEGDIQSAIDKPTFEKIKASNDYWQDIFTKQTGLLGRFATEKEIAAGKASRNKNPHSGNVSYIIYDEAPLTKKDKKTLEIQQQQADTSARNATTAEGKAVVTAGKEAEKIETPKLNKILSSVNTDGPDKLLTYLTEGYIDNSDLNVATKVKLRASIEARLKALDLDSYVKYIESLGR